MKNFITGEAIASAHTTIEAFTKDAVAAEARGDHRGALNKWRVVGHLAALLEEDAQLRLQNQRREEANVAYQLAEAARHGAA